MSSIGLKRPFDQSLDQSLEKSSSGIDAILDVATIFGIIDKNNQVLKKQRSTGIDAILNVAIFISIMDQAKGTIIPLINYDSKKIFEFLQIAKNQYYAFHKDPIYFEKVKKDLNNIRLRLDIQYQMLNIIIDPKYHHIIQSLNKFLDNVCACAQTFEKKIEFISLKVKQAKMMLYIAVLHIMINNTRCECCVKLYIGYIKFFMHGASKFCSESEKIKRAEEY